MRQTIKIEQFLKNHLSLSLENIHYFKMESLLRARILNDPVGAAKIELELQEMRRKDASLDQTTINIFTILNGNTGSIIASFRNEQGKIINFSERVPSIFGYDSAADL